MCCKPYTCPVQVPILVLFWWMFLNQKKNVLYIRGTLPLAYINIVHVHIRIIQNVKSPSQTFGKVIHFPVIAVNIPFNRCAKKASYLLLTVWGCCDPYHWDVVLKYFVIVNAFEPFTWGY